MWDWKNWETFFSEWSGISVKKCRKLLFWKQPASIETYFYENFSPIKIFDIEFRNKESTKNDH